MQFQGLATLLTTAEVARRCGVVRWTVCRAVAEGQLRPIAKLPTSTGAYLFTEEAVTAWRPQPERLAGL
jgi:predicted site-specific integrase-resolvase